jgi:hypothetical protein
LQCNKWCLHGFRLANNSWCRYRIWRRRNVRKSCLVVQ